MKQMSLTTVVIGASTFACAALLSFSWSEQRGVSLSVESAQARVGRPLTPVSVAGVARRQTRRAVYGAGVVGAGAAAVGTAAAIGTAGAVAATSPNWGWGGNPYQTGTGYTQVVLTTVGLFGAPGRLLRRLPIRRGMGGSPSYTGAGYNAGGPYYGGGVLGARAAYYGAYGNNYGSYGAYNGGDTDAVAYCTQRFRSYDPASGSYLGYDGLRHACP